MKPPGRACGRNDMVGLLEPPPTSSIPGRANRAPLSPRIPGLCRSRRIRDKSGAARRRRSASISDQELG